MTDTTPPKVPKARPISGLDDSMPVQPWPDAEPDGIQPAPTAQPVTDLMSISLRGVSVVIPAYNEELVIGSVVLKACKIVQKVIVVDDGSSDRTADVARYAGAEVIRLQQNHGKAFALILGLQKARDLGCRAAVTFDGDGQHTTQDIPRVVKPVLDAKADLVIGSRFLEGKNGVPAYRRAGQRALDVFTTIGSGHRCTDSQSGFRAFSQKALNNLDFSSTGYNIESDMIAHFSERGLTIAEVPISVRYEVPHKHKMNPIRHGLEVLARIINVISYRRPLIAFGIPGFLLFVIGVLIGSLAFTEYYITTKFPFTESMVSAALIGLGLLLIIAGLILNVLVVVLRDNNGDNKK
jgi:glycosyltransferase involved in cell wall biosynthesis